jgi:hypothetical protein
VEGKDGRLGGTKDAQMGCLLRAFFLYASMLVVRVTKKNNGNNE